VNLKDGLKLFYMKDSKLHTVNLSPEQEYIFENLALPLVSEVGKFKVDLQNPICELAIQKREEK